MADALLVFCWTVSTVAMVQWLLAAWQRHFTVWPVAEYAALLTVPLLWLYWTGADPADYGLRRTCISRHLGDAVRCGIPFSAFALLSFVNWGGFSIRVSMAAGIAALFLFGYVLRDRPRSSGVIAPCLLLPLAMGHIPPAASGLAFYLLLLGPGEEVLFRGVIQSRLNLGFGRPFNFRGARWGWGAVLASLLFAGIRSRV